MRAHRLASVLVLLAIPALLPSYRAAPAASTPMQLTATVDQVPQLNPRILEGRHYSFSYISSVDFPGQEVNVYTTLPNVSLASGETLNVVSRSAVPDASARDAAMWIAAHAFNTANSVIPGVGSFDIYKTRAAAQLAIWYLYGHVSKATLAPTLIGQRALELAEEASRPHQSISYPTAVSLSLERTNRYWSGAEFQGQLLNENSNGVAASLVPVFDNDNVVQMRRTGPDGNFKLDWKWQGGSHHLTARWSMSLPIGTLLRDSQQNLLITTQGLRVQRNSKSVSASRPNHTTLAKIAAEQAWQSVPGGVALVVAVAAAGFALLSGLLLLFVKQALTSLPLKAILIVLVTSVIIVVLVGSLITWQIYRDQKHHFNALGDYGGVSDTQSDIHELPVKYASATSSFAANSFSPACAIDTQREGTAWVSGRGRGAGQSLTLTLRQYAYITEIRIMPGVLASEREYLNNGVPPRIIVAGADGRAQAISLTPRRPYQRALVPQQKILNPPILTNYLILHVDDMEADSFSYGISDVRVLGVPSGVGPTTSLDYSSHRANQPAPPCAG